MPQMKLFGNSRSAARVAGKRKPDSEQAPKEKKQKKKNSKQDKEEKKDPAEYPAGFSYSWNCASGHADYKNK